jgi:hypothetical protein
MASKQMSNQRHSQNSGKGGQSGQNERWPSMDTAQEYMDSAREYVSDVANRLLNFARPAASKCAAWSADAKAPPC